MEELILPPENVRLAAVAVAVATLVKTTVNQLRELEAVAERHGWDGRGRVQGPRDPRREWP
jgi:hypothetical protein